MRGGCCLSLLLLIIMPVAFSLDIVQHLATKTPYRVVGVNFTDGNVDYKGYNCKLLHVNMLMRHGTRNPTKSSFSSLKKLFFYLKENVDKIIVPSVKEMVSKWEWKFVLEDAGSLVNVGVIEQMEIARSSMEFFGWKGSSPQDFAFFSSNSSRAISSGEAFRSVLFPNKSANMPPINIKKSDKFLRPFVHCDRYLDWRYRVRAALKKEYNSWITSKISPIADRLSREIFCINISTSDAISMFVSCAFQFAIDNNAKDWCSIFTKEEVLVFEYGFDLRSYYQLSYARKNSYKILGPLLKEMERNIIRAVNKRDPKVADLYFAHAETVVPFATVLGLFKDPYELRANLSDRDIERRKFRTSEISPFSSNIAIAAYDCNDDAFDEKIQLRLFHNGKPINFGLCHGVDKFCGFQDFTNVYHKYLNTSWEKICNIEDL